jgi:hypothetical protein
MKSWLQPPRLRIGEESEHQPRHATWLELFYDLVFVVAFLKSPTICMTIYRYQDFSALCFCLYRFGGHGLALHSTPTDFDSDDIGHRLLTVCKW